MGLLREASAPVATTIKSKTQTQNGEVTGQQPAVRHFGRKDGPFLSRILTVRPGPGGRALFSRSGWSNFQQSSLPALFNGPHMRQIGSAIEIQHSMQHFQNIVDRARCGGGPVLPPAQRPVQRAPLLLALALVPNPTALPTPQSAPLTAPFPPAPTALARPASAPSSAVGPAPTAVPMRYATRSPAPIEDVGMLVVRLPSVAAPLLVAPSPLAVTPVTTTYPRGWVDSRALAWYRREEQLRAWLRFGEAAVVESEDVWRGW